METNLTAAPPTILSAEILDVDALAGQFGDGLIGECVQLSAGPFHARWTTARLAASVVQFSREEAASIHRIAIPRTKYVFFVPLSPASGVRWDGHRLGEDAVIIAHPGSEGVLFNPGGVDFAAVSIAGGGAPDWVVAAARRAVPSAASTVVLPPHGERAELIDALTRLRATAEFRCEPISPDVLQRLEAGVLDRLRRCVTLALPGRRRDPQPSRSTIVRRAERLFQEQGGDAVSIAGLSKAIGVSERSFRNAFYRVCSTGPKRYLRIWQLHQVRRSLRRASGRMSTVTAVATEHGFLELGRFAGEYRALFGESPSRTLQRARLRQTPVAAHSA
jgi:AraC-like DNA-binding protein